MLHCCEIFQNKGYGDGEDIGLLQSGIPRKQGVSCHGEFWCFSILFILFSVGTKSGRSVAVNIT